MKSWHVETIEKEIISYLEAGKKAYIESGVANDRITAYRTESYKRYSWMDYEEKEIYFQTSACIFPKEIQLENYSDCDCEDYNGNLFVKVW